MKKTLVSVLTAITLFAVLAPASAHGWRGGYGGGYSGGWHGANLFEVTLWSEPRRVAAGGPARRAEVRLLPW